MNKKIQKGLKLLMLGTVVGALSIPVIAKPALQKIEAFLNPTLTYMLDGQEIMDGVDAITYNNTTYISLAELSKALGKDINYDNGVITMTTPNPQTKSDEGAKLPEYETIEKALIKEVDLEKGRVTVLPEGKEDDFMNYIILNIDPETVNVRHEFLKIGLTADALVPGYEVSVKHSPIMTMSIPPQTPTFEIIILGGQEFPLVEEETSALPKAQILENATIKEINLESNQVTVLPQGLEDNFYNYVTLNVDPDTTFIHHERNRMMYYIDMLEEGMKITAKHSPIMTASIPPQTPTFEIMILADQGK